MTPSPLLMDDISLIQDVFVTKTLMLLARDASPAEWQFERHVAQNASGARWAEMNAFLFDFTLGRALCADHDDALTVAILAHLMTPIAAERGHRILRDLPAGYRS